MNQRQRGIVLVQLVWIIAGFFVLAAAAWHPASQDRISDTQFTTPYQAEDTIRFCPTYTTS